MSLETITLSLIQALTEFLPISSSGHLILAEKFGLSHQSLLMDVALHVGTLIAVVAYFYKDILNLVCNFYKKGPAQKLALQLIFATIPAGLAGLFLQDIIESIFRNPIIIAYTSIIYGVLLWIGDTYCKKTKQISTLSYRDALILGCAQALALIPGTSRSGVTMTTARFLGINRVDSAKFSMLMSIPVIFLGAGYMFLTSSANGQLSPQILTQLGTGIIFTALFGLIAVWFLINWLKRTSFALFAIYRIALGVFLLFYFM